MSHSKDKQLDGPLRQYAPYMPPLPSMAPLARAAALPGTKPVRTFRGGLREVASLASRQVAAVSSRVRSSRHWLASHRDYLIWWPIIFGCITVSATWAVALANDARDRHQLFADKLELPEIRKSMRALQAVEMTYYMANSRFTSHVVNDWEADTRITQISLVGNKGYQATIASHRRPDIACRLLFDLAALDTGPMVCYKGTEPISE